MVTRECAAKLKQVAKMALYATPIKPSATTGAA